MYLTKEPTVYEAMALVHSRVRRVVFGIRDRAMGGLGGAADVDSSHIIGIHSLPGTNHHYRAFRLDMGNTGFHNEVEVEALVKALKGFHQR